MAHEQKMLNNLNRAHNNYVTTPNIAKKISSTQGELILFAEVGSGVTITCKYICTINLRKTRRILRGLEIKY